MKLADTVRRNYQKDHDEFWAEVGAGEIALWLVEKGYEIYGVDIAPTAITWAQENAKEHNIKADFRVGDVLDLQDYPASNC